jgi:hypothetical protein
MLEGLTAVQMGGVVVVYVVTCAVVAGVGWWFVARIWPPQD